MAALMCFRCLPSANRECPDASEACVLFCVMSMRSSLRRCWSGREQMVQGRLI
jgi:hypothetical protein